VPPLAKGKYKNKATIEVHWGNLIVLHSNNI